MAEIILELDGVKKHFKDVDVLEGIDLKVERGEIGRASCRERV